MLQLAFALLCTGHFASWAWISSALKCPKIPARARIVGWMREDRLGASRVKRFGSLIIHKKKKVRLSTNNRPNAVTKFGSLKRFKISGHRVSSLVHENQFFVNTFQHKNPELEGARRPFTALCRRMEV